MTKVLVYDDTVTDLTHIKNLVEEVGCVTVTVSSGIDALNKVRTEKPDLIFLDLIMPDLYEQ